MQKFYGVARIERGNILWPKAESLKLAKFKKLFEGKNVLITFGEISEKRSDEFHRLYRKRNEQIASYTGYDANWHHEQFMKKANLGVRIDYEVAISEAETQTERNNLKVSRFFRDSASNITTEDMKLLFQLQDELVAELNEGEDPATWITLASGENHGQRVKTGKTE